MLTPRSPPSRVAISPQGEGRDNSIGLKAFLKCLAKDTSRLTYQKYRQSKYADSHSEPKHKMKSSKHGIIGPFLPLLPLPGPDAQQDTHGDCLPKLNKAAELQVSRPLARRKSRSPKILKVYGKAEGPPPLRNAKARPTSARRPVEAQEASCDGDDHALDEANPVSCEKQDNVITKGLARKRMTGAEADFAEDGNLIANRSFLQQRKRPRRLQVSGLTLARTDPSLTVSEEDYEKCAYLDEIDVIDAIEKTSPRIPIQQEANIKKARKPKPVSQIRTSLKVPAPERICSEDFVFPRTPTTPESTRSLDWTPGSGFAGLPLTSISRRVPMKCSRKRDRRSDPIYVGQLRVKKVLAPTHLDDDSPTTRRTRAKRKRLTNEGTAPFSESAATARSLLDLATRSPTSKVARRNIQSSYLEASNHQNKWSSQLQRDKVAGRGSEYHDDEATAKRTSKPQADDLSFGAKVPEEPGPRKELFEDGHDAMAINEENRSQAEDESFEDEAHKEPVPQGIQSGFRASMQTELQNDDSARRQEGRGYDSKINNAAPIFPTLEYLHPPSSMLQPPTSHFLEQPHVSSQAEHHTSSEEDSSEADNEMLESDWYPTLPEPISQPIHEIYQHVKPPTPQQAFQPPSLFASQPSPRDMTPSNQPTDPQARLEIIDSQPVSRPLPKYRTPGDLPRYKLPRPHSRHE